MKIAFINDTSLWEDHFGCQLVGQSFRENCIKNDIEIIACCPRDFDEEAMSRIFDQCDLLVVNGEGSIHHNKNQHLLNIAEKWPTVLINAVWQDNDYRTVYKKLKLASFRESNSHSAWTDYEQETCPSLVIPDLVFGSAMVREFRNMRANADYAISGSILTDDVYYAARSRRKIKGWLKRRQYQSGEVMGSKMPPGFVLQSISRAEIVNTGRFHAVALSIACGTPFYAWSSNTHKIEGLLKDASLQERYIGSSYVDRHPKCSYDVEKGSQYYLDSQVKIEKLFASLHDL